MVHQLNEVRQAVAQAKVARLMSPASLNRSLMGRWSERRSKASISNKRTKRIKWWRDSKSEWRHLIWKARSLFQKLRCRSR